MKKIFISIILSFVTCSSNASVSLDKEKGIQIQQVNPYVSENSDQVVAVVLAGGGAKGAAHIGVLKALEELNIPIDIITGTSMGAYIGGLYATGLTASEIEIIIENVDWNDGYNDRVERAQKRVKDKRNDDRYQIQTDLGINSSSIKVSKGILQGQAMMDILRKTTGNIPSMNSFDDLAIRYRAVATDIETLQAVVIDSGKLTDAMMASMSVPGMLPPYLIDGKMLVDGSVSNNMPVILAHQMGADVIIAVDVSSDYIEGSEINGMFDVLSQLSVHMVKRSTEQQKNAMMNDDIFIRPAVGKIQTTDFSSMPIALTLGYKEALFHEAKLSALGVTPSHFQRYLEDKKTKRAALLEKTAQAIDAVVINNNSHYDDAVISGFITAEAGEKYTNEQLAKEVRSLYALDTFELINYGFNEENGNQLVIDVNEKSWGPNYIDFRFYLEEDFTTDSNYSIGMTTNFTDLDDRGSELRLSTDLGTNKHLEVDFFAPINARQSVFYTASSYYYSDKRDVLFANMNNTSALEGNSDYVPYSFKEVTAELALGFQPNFSQEFKAGIRVSSGKTYISPGLSFGEIAFERQGLFARYMLDTLDHALFPNNGVRVKLDYLYSHDNGENAYISADPSFEGSSEEFNVQFQFAKTLDRQTISTLFEYGGVNKDDDVALINPVKLGGFMNLSGIPRDSLIGQRKALSSAAYRYRWFENDFGLFQSPVYLGAALEYGGVWNDTDINLDEESLYKSGSLFIGIDSPIGPVVASYSHIETGLETFYLMIGVPFP